MTLVLNGSFVVFHLWAFFYYKKNSPRLKQITFNISLCLFFGLTTFNSQNYFLNHTLNFDYYYFIKELFWLLVFDDTFSFWLHFAFHKNSFLYHNVHSKHHEIKCPQALDHIYTHFLEIIKFNWNFSGASFPWKSSISFSTLLLGYKKLS